MVEEGGMHRLPDNVVAAERKGDIAHTTAHVDPRQILFNPGSSPNKVDSIIVMLLHSRGHRQNIRVKNYILRREANA